MWLRLWQRQHNTEWRQSITMWRSREKDLCIVSPIPVLSSEVSTCSARLDGVYQLPAGLSIPKRYKLNWTAA